LRPLRPRDVIGPALRTYRERFWRVAATALVVFGSVCALDVLVVVLIDEHLADPRGEAVASVAAAVFATVGVVFYAGVLDKVVGAHIHGHPDLTTREILRVIPLHRLAAADVLLAIAVVAGLALFVVPGVVAFTLWSLVGPIITIEDRAVGAAFRRSWQLVRPHFWITLCLVTVPVQVEQAVLHAVHYADVFAHPLLPAFLLNGLLGAVIGSIVGLVEVVLAYELIERDRSAQRAQPVATPPLPVSAADRTAGTPPRCRGRTSFR
jgi:hypothetical protein